MRKLLLGLGLMALSIAGASQNPIVRKGAVQQYVDSVASLEPLKSGLMGMLAVTADGDTLVNFNSLRKLIPASNTKLITTGVALYYLGPDFDFVTELGYTGKIRHGVLHGNIIIKGGGDPTLGTIDSLALKPEDLFASWKDSFTKSNEDLELKRTQIRKIKGRIIGDGSYFDGPIEKSSWAYDDLGTDYGTGCNGLMFNENVQQFMVSPGSEVGESVAFVPIYPHTPWMDFNSTAITSKAGSGDNLSLFNTDMAPIAEFRGDYAIDKGSRIDIFSNKFGARTCANAFYEYLQGRGIKVTGGATDEVPEDSSYVFLCKTHSAPLKDIIRETNYKSDNLFAETLLRTVGKKFTGSASYDSSYVAERKVFTKLGVDYSYGAQIVDGSGLSRHNYISPDFFCRFLRAMSGTEVFKDYLRSLPQAGSGTLKNRLKNLPDSTRSRIFMKSGSMNGVLCYSGYILPAGENKGKMIYFSIMTNNCTVPSGKVGSILDGVIGTLAINQPIN
jgi:D-alanyl-D-alanine carboxypeptidase/D-alanyl-D-alanine-endopeptidase (penicillin-binding protein 4)